uniref:Uncharacterized protein n=1 Tax=Ciona savignyi TaxID=51511 RepID=H2ZKT8_CIOSA
MKTTLLLFLLFVYFHQLEAAYYPILPCANNTGRSSTGCSSKCVKYEPYHTPGRKSYHCRDLHCEFEFNLNNFSWTFDEQHCPGLKNAKISVVLFRNGETEHRFIEGCCDISLSQKSCTPLECLPGIGGTLYYFVKKEDLCVKYLQKNTPKCKNICKDEAGSTDLRSCNPHKDSETDQSFEP